jgi:hypothetical protein
MATTESAQHARRVTDTSAGNGWLAFASILLGLAGAWNCIVGLLALNDSKVYTRNSQFVFSDLRTWGWIMLALGILELFAAFTVFSGSSLAKWVGILAAAANGLGQLAFIPVQPWWAISMLALDVLVIYGLTVYGGEKATQ